MKLATLTYVGTSDHETYEVGNLSVRPTDELLSELRRDEFLACAGDDEFGKTVEAFLMDGLFRELTLEEMVARGLDTDKMPGRLMVLDRPRLADLGREFGSVRQRVNDLLGDPRDYLPSAPDAIEVVTPDPVNPPAPCPPPPQCVNPASAAKMEWGSQ